MRHDQSTLSLTARRWAFVTAVVKFWISLLIAIFSMMISSGHAELPAERAYAELFPETQLPSFDCEQAELTDIEQMVCDSALLSYLDRMAHQGLLRNQELYEDSAARDLIGQRAMYVGTDFYGGDSFYDRLKFHAPLYHQELLRERSKCETSECLTKHYLLNARYCDDERLDESYLYDNSRIYLHQVGYDELDEFCDRLHQEGLGTPLSSILFPPYMESSGTYEEEEYSQTVTRFVHTLQDYQSSNAKPSVHFMTGYLGRDGDYSIWKDEFGDRWGRNKGILRVFKTYPDTSKLICGLPIILQAQFPESMFLPQLEAISRVDLREDAEFRVMNHYHRFRPVDYGLDEPPMRRFKGYLGILELYDDYPERERFTDDPTPYWITVRSTKTPYCFPNTGVDKGGYLYRLSNLADIYGEYYPGERKYEYGNSQSFLYKHFLGDRDPRYHQQMAAFIDATETYIKTPAQLKIGKYFLGAGNPFYSLGVDSPEGWYLYDGLRLSSAWHPDNYDQYPRYYLDKQVWNEARQKWEWDFHADIRPNPFRSDIAFRRINIFLDKRSRQEVPADEGFIYHDASYYDVLRAGSWGFSGIEVFALP